MRNPIYAVVVFTVMGLGAAHQACAITEVQGAVIEAFETLKMTLLPSKALGGPRRLKITKEAIELLQQALDDDKVIVVATDGTIKIEKAPK